MTNEYSDHEERIHDFEKISAEKRLIALEEKIINLQLNHIDKMWVAINSIIKNIHRIDEVLKKDKKPYKCPVCDGARYGKQELRASFQSMSVDGIQVKEGDSFYFKPTCTACEGKGIVWG